MSRMRQLLDAAALSELFLEELGWDHVPDMVGLDLNDSALLGYGH